VNRVILLVTAQRGASKNGSTLVGDKDKRFGEITSFSNEKNTRQRTLVVRPNRWIAIKKGDLERPPFSLCYVTFTQLVAERQDLVI
jgi:hypothetical protein